MKHFQLTWFSLVTACALAGTTAAEEPKPAADLSWVPPDCAGFVHIRFHDLWESPVGKNMVKIATSLDPKLLDAAEHEIGIPLSRIDRITVLLPDIQDDSRHSGVAIRLTTTRPYNRRDVLDALKIQPGDGGPDRGSPRGDLYMLRDRGMLHLSDANSITILPAEHGAMALLARFLSGHKSGRLSPALEAAAGKHHLVAAVDLTQLPRIPVSELPPELRGLRPLLDARVAMLVGNLGEKNADLELRLTFAGKEDVVEGKTALDEGLKSVLDLLAKAETDLNRNAKENALQLALIKEIKDGLNTAKVEQKDNDVAVKVQVRTAEPVAQLLVNGTEMIRQSASRTQSQNNLKQLGLALHNFNDAYGKLPPAAICDKSGKPMLSWRVAILPFIEQDNLYRQFHLDEPWDSEHNIKLIQQMPKTYALPNDKAQHTLPSTYYQALVGNHAAFELQGGLSIPASFPDGTSNTIWIVEAAKAVPWTKPEDIEYDPMKMPPIGFHFGDRTNAAFVDGSVRALPKKLDQHIWHLLIQRDDGQPIPDFDK
jgi:prepilin-type processing-associated H-X9-DG protein